ncbi:MAG: protease inhibitor I42 family protein [Anaerolineae bacterium]|nr:protease inhibitor I42 family protein [Anaerolineae bacterium]
MLKIKNLSLAVVLFLASLMGFASPTEAAVDAAEAAPIAAMRQKLAFMLGQRATTIRLISSVATTFNDSCFGLGLANELCAQAITPGHKITFMHGGRRYVFHTNSDGSASRMPRQFGVFVSYNRIVINARVIAAKQFGVNRNTVPLIDSQPVSITPPCLPNNACPAIALIGYALTFVAKGQAVTINMGTDGNVISDRNPVNVSAAEAGQTVTIRANDQLVLTLEGNPTTGYVWAVAPDSTKLLKQIGQYEYVAANSGMVGSGGQFVFRFGVTGTGTGKLKLIYHRPFETGVAPIKTFEVNINAIAAN